MRFISTRVHGVLDYAIGVLLMLAPSLLQFNQGGAETWVPIILGAGAVLYSLLTRYELGVVKVIPMKGHLTLDFLSGLLLASSPWLFGFADTVWAPHLVLGLLEIGASLMTQTVPGQVTGESATARSAHRV